MVVLLENWHHDISWATHCATCCRGPCGPIEVHCGGRGGPTSYWDRGNWDSFVLVFFVAQRTLDLLIVLAQWLSPPWTSPHPHFFAFTFILLGAPPDPHFEFCRPIGGAQGPCVAQGELFKLSPRALVPYTLYLVLREKSKIRYVIYFPQKSNSMNCFFYPRGPEGILMTPLGELLLGPPGPH